MKPCCQYHDGKELVECGYLVGAYCKRDPKKKFFVDYRFRDNLGIVGCMSFGKYLDYDVKVEDETKVQELQVGEMGRDRSYQRKGGNQTLPMQELQEGGHAEGTTSNGQPAVGDLGTCSFCKEPAIKSDMGILYCRNHARKMGL